jgi:hypothetical protein
MPSRYFILGEPTPESRARKLLGRVVQDITSPLRAFAPREAQDTSIGGDPQSIIPNLLPTPFESTKGKDSIRNNISNEARTHLTDFFGFNIAKIDEDKLVLESNVVKRYSLEQTKDVFDRLMEDPVYSSEVRQFFKKHRVREAYFVVGFITTEGSVWTRTSSRGHEAGVNGQVPLSAIAVVPIPGTDVGLKLSTSDNQVREQKFSSKESLVFAVAYDVVKWKKRFNKSVAGYFRDDVVLGPAKYAKAKYLAMAGDEEEIIEEEDENEDVGAEDKVEVGGGLELEDLESGWDGLSFTVK